MRRTFGVLLTLVALAGCAAQQRSAVEESASPAAAKRSIVRVDVTNSFGRGIDVYYGTEFLGTLAPGAHGSYTVEPGQARLPIYARWTGRSERSFDISRGGTVRYVYGDAAPAGR